MNKLKIFILLIFLFSCATIKKEHYIEIIGEARNFKGGAVVISNKDQKGYYLDGIKSWSNDICSWEEGGENKQVKVFGVLVIMKLKPKPKIDDATPAQMLGTKRTIINPKWEVVPDSIP